MHQWHCRRLVVFTRWFSFLHSHLQIWLASIVSLLFCNAHTHLSLLLSHGAWQVAVFIVLLFFQSQLPAKRESCMALREQCSWPEHHGTYWFCCPWVSPCWPAPVAVKLPSWYSRFTSQLGRHRNSQWAVLSGTLQLLNIFLFTLYFVVRLATVVVVIVCVPNKVPALANERNRLL